MTYQCLYCSNAYEIKLNYDRHRFICMFKHKSKSQKQNDLENIEPKLTETERDKLIRSMFLKIQKMDTVIHHLKEDIDKLKKKQKINILEFLNSENGIVPILPLKEWIYQIDVSISHLIKAFETDLIQGMMECLKQAIIISPNIPFCSFIQKNKTLFVYRIPIISTSNSKPKPRWEIMNHDEMKKLLVILAYRFLQIFMQWKEENYFPEEKEWQEKMMIYTKKITDICENTQNTRAHRILDWFINYIQRNFVEYEII